MARSEVHRGHTNNLYPAYVWIQAVTEDGSLLPGEQGWAPRLLLRRPHVHPQYAMPLKTANGDISGSMHFVHHMDQNGKVLLKLAGEMVEIPEASCALLESITDVHSIRHWYYQHHTSLDPAQCFDGFACRITRAVWGSNI